jgi:hypothetical protein
MKEQKEIEKNKKLVNVDIQVSEDVEISEPRKNRVSNISGEAQNKIVRLFTYLEKALAIDDSIVRDFRTSLAAPSPFWLADYPLDLENLHIRPFDTEKTPEGVQSTAWLRVEKKNIKSAPALPSLLEEWVDEVNPLQAPADALTRMVAYAKDLGIDEGEFKACATSNKYDEKINTQMSSGQAAGISGTPGNIIYDMKSKKGIIVSGAQPIGNFSKIIDAMLKDPSSAFALEGIEMANNVPQVDFDEDHIRGDKGAKIAIIEYSDYQCPFCHSVHPTYKKLLQL